MSYNLISVRNMSRIFSAVVAVVIL